VEQGGAVMFEIARLKPCPFCGRFPRLTIDEEDARLRKGGYFFPDYVREDGRAWFVEIRCPDKECFPHWTDLGGDDSEMRPIRQPFAKILYPAIKRWNRRPKLKGSP
jgi:hypothetical protein